MPDWPHLPSWIAQIDVLALVHLAIGLSLKLALPRDELKPLAAGLALKLAVMPALAIGVAWALGLRGVQFDTAVLESAMPPMITAAALAISHRLAPGLASAMVGYGILISLATLPAWAWLLRHAL